MQRLNEVSCKLPNRLLILVFLLVFACLIYLLRRQYQWWHTIERNQDFFSSHGFFLSNPKSFNFLSSSLTQILILKLHFLWQFFLSTSWIFFQLIISNIALQFTTNHNALFVHFITPGLVQMYTDSSIYFCFSLFRALLLSLTSSHTFSFSLTLYILPPPSCYVWVETSLQ